MSSGNVFYAVDDGAYVLKFVGDVRLEFGARIDAFIEQLDDDAALAEVLVDLTEAEHVDSTSLGLLAKLSQMSSARLAHVPVLICRDRSMLGFLGRMGFTDLFEIVDCSPALPDCVNEIPAVKEDEAATRASVLSAHRLLMTLNEHNAREFKDLVQILEQGIDP